VSGHVRESRYNRPAPAAVQSAFLSRSRVMPSRSRIPVPVPRPSRPIASRPVNRPGIVISAGRTGAFRTDSATSNSPRCRSFCDVGLQQPVEISPAQPPASMVEQPGLIGDSRNRRQRSRGPRPPKLPAALRVVAPGPEALRP
jgi:hypothetical protein